MFSAAKTSGLTGYTLNRSLRLRSSASAYLNRSQTAGSTTTWTWSGWVKRGTLGVNARLAAAGSITGTYNYTQLTFDTSDRLVFAFYPNTNDGWLTTTQVFRDPSAWYHIVAVFDSTNATSTNRMRLYVNGSQVTSFTTGTFATTYPNQNDGSYFNNASYGVRIGNSVPGDTAYYFDGYMTEVNFIDGQALTPSSFGSFNATTGVWQPIKYTGTYGTNGFYLNFNNNASTTTLGYDTSGNSNNWTTNNISLTAGVTYDSMTDVPTLTSATAANYAVMNPIGKVGSMTLSNGNLTLTGGSDAAQTPSTIGMSSGKWYYEHTITAIGGEQSVGIGTSLNSGSSAYIGSISGQYGYYMNGNKYTNSSGSTYGASYTTGDVIGVAYDADAGSLTFYKNGTSQGVAFTGITGTFFALAASRTTGGTNISDLNFGQRPFSYTPPTGFVALNTYNLPTPTIVNGAAYMAATKYTGTGTTQSINNGTSTTIGTTFQPDLVWMKSRSVTDYNLLVDSVRGVGKWLTSNSTLAEVTADTNVLTSFNSNGFTVGADPQGSDAGWNPSGASQIAWQWKAGNGSSSNTNGSITSTVSVNATAGFSVVSYTGTGANATVGHGLGVAPSFIITKVRSASGADWGVYHSAIGATQYLLLDTTAAAASSANFWNNTAPTSSVFSVGVGGSTNNSGNTMIAYCWSAVAGFSKFGSYVGNSSTDGPFVFTNFQPRWLMIKRTDSTSDWYIFDTSRDTYNVEAATLFADTSGTETSATSIDGLSNGFKCRSTTVVNASGATYVYAAFASNPFKNSLAR